MFTLSRNKDGRLQGLQRQVAAQRAELEQARTRIGELEEALATACDYADVCGHSPGRDALLQHLEIHRATD